MDNVMYGKIAVAVVTLALCGWMLYRGRVSATKVIFGLGLAVYAFLGLLVNPAEKRIRQLEGEVAMLPEQDPVHKDLKNTLERSRANWNDILHNPARLAERLSPLTLGLDMLGGTELRLKLSVDPTAFQQRTAELDALRVRLAEASAAADAAPEALEQLKKDIAEKEKAVNEERTLLQGNVTNAVDIIRQRLNNSGLAEIPVAKQGDDRVLIQLPGMDPEEADIVIDTIMRQGKLEFRIVANDTEAGALLQLIRARQQDVYKEDTHNLYLLDGAVRIAEPHEVDPATGMLSRPGMQPIPVYDWLAAPAQYNTVTGDRRPPVFQLVNKKVELEGKYVTDAGYEPDIQRNGFRITMAFDREGAMQFESVSRRFLKREMAIVLDGRLQSAPTLQSVITGGRAEITGSFTQAEAKQLSVVLKSGSLRAKINEEYRNKVGATLGEDSIRSGLMALVYGFAAVVLFMLVYYRAAGGVTDVLLVVNVVFIISCLAALGATMTLPGLAGLVLTLGMNVDANVLIFERIREERAKGNPLTRAVQLGYGRAFVTIVDANITTLITALILHSFGTEQVKGFAMTLIVGILTGMFCSIVMTRWVLDWFIERRWITELKMMKLMDKPNLNPIGARKFCFTISGLAIILGMSLFIARGSNNLGQDLTGGVLVQINTERPYSMRAAREAAGAAFGDRFPDARDSLQSQGDAYAEGEGAARKVVLSAEGERQFTSFTLRTKFVEANEDDVERLRAENPEARVYSETDFRLAIDEAFQLVDNGLDVNRAAIPEQAPEGETAYRTKLSLIQPVAPRELGVALVVQEGIMPLWIGGEHDALPMVNGLEFAVAAERPATEDEAAVRAAAAKAVAALGVDWVAAGEPVVTLGATPAGDNPVRPVHVKFATTRPVDQAELDAAFVAKPEAALPWDGAKWNVIVSVTSTEALVARTITATGAGFDQAAAVAAFVEQLKPLEGTLFADGAAPLWSRAETRGGGFLVRLVMPLAGHRTQAELSAAIAERAANDADFGETTIRRMALYAHPESANEPVRAFQTLVSLPLRDDLGGLRKEPMLYKAVRELFQGIQQRSQGAIAFNDPMPRFTSVGASVAAEMATNSLMAIFYSLIAIFIYIWLRFQFRAGFSLAAVIGLTHDVLITLGALALVDQLGLMNGQIDLTVVAALLTVVGYSLNNTIVIFDRIREHAHDASKPAGEYVNRAVNETFSRTIITAGTTMAVVVFLFLMGGEVIRGFAFALLIGIGAGTYSSIYIVGPLLAIFTKMTADKERAKLLAGQNRPRPASTPEKAK